MQFGALVWFSSRSGNSGGLIELGVAPSVGYCRGPRADLHAGGKTAGGEIVIVSSRAITCYHAAPLITG